jgi:hypothetical protein
MELRAVKLESGTWDIAGLPHWTETLAMINKNLANKINFKFARYGDGEFNCMFGKEGKNCDKHIYYTDLGAKLRTSFSKNVITGIQPLSLTLPYADRINYLVKGLDLVNADVLHNASITGLLPEFMLALENRRVICIGPIHLATIFDDMIIISNENCWQDYEHVKDVLKDLIEPDLVVILCASMMSEVLIKDFEKEDITMIDAGSVFDPYVGVKSRKYHHNLKI